MTNKAPYSWRMPIYAPFTDALTPPSVDPVTETDMVSVCFNKAYLPFILGALAVYTYDDAFNLDNSPEQAAVQRFYTLIGIFAAAIEDCGMFDFDVRQNEDEPCILEKFVDGEWVQFANLRLCPPLVRLNINFEIEISFDNGETWETLTDNPIPPIPEPLPGYDPLCLASASVVVAIDETYKEIRRLFQDEVSVYTIAAAAISLIGTFIFFPPALPYVITFFTELYALLSEITDDELDDETKEELKCILLNNGEVIDGAAHFNFDAVVDEVNSRWGLLDVNIWAAIEYILRVIQPGGLDMAGSTGVATDETCACGECITFNASLDDGLDAGVFIPQVNSDNSTLPIMPAITPQGVYNSGSLGGRTGYIAQQPFIDGVSVAVLVDLGQECSINAWSVETFSSEDSHFCDGYVFFGFLDGDFNQIIPSYGGGCWGGDNDWRTLYQTGITVTARYLFAHVMARAGQTVAIKQINVTVDTP